MNFSIVAAKETDLPIIMEIMQEAKQLVKDPDWYEIDTTETVKAHIDREGFILLALTDEQEVAGFLIVRDPKEANDNLGEYLSLPEEEKRKVIHFEHAVVRPEFQGNQLQYRLFAEAEKMILQTDKKYLMATVHPDNRFSYQNMKKLGMRKIIQTEK